MKANVLAFFAGALFGTGLIFSRLADPGRVLAFLDLAAGSDPALPITMALSASTFAVLYRAALRPGSWFGRSIERPRPGRIDGRLAIGASLFGAGWGLAGLCPGPAVVSLGALAPGVGWFLPAMLAGLFVGDAPRALVARPRGARWAL